MSRETKPRDIAIASAIARLEDSIKDFLKEATVSYPEGPDDIAKWEWCRITSMMIVEMVKRKGTSPEVMVKHARRAVEMRLRREAAESVAQLVLEPLLEGISVAPRLGVAPPVNRPPATCDDDDDCEGALGS